MTRRSKTSMPLLPLAVLIAFATAPKTQIAGLTLQPASAQSAPSATVPLPPQVAQRAKAFLGFATTPANQRVIEATLTAAAPTTPSPAPEATVSPQTTAPASATPAEKTAPNPWWWLLLPVIGIPLLVWLFRREQATPLATPAAVPASDDRNRIILTPRHCRDAYAYWELLDDERATADRNLAVRLYDVTEIDLERQQPHSMKQFDCPPGAQDIHLPIALDDRDYLVEIGYSTEDDGWTKLARSPQVRVPKCAPGEPLVPAVNPGIGTASIGTAAAAAAATLVGTGGIDQPSSSGSTVAPEPVETVGETVTAGDRAPDSPTPPTDATPVAESKPAASPIASHIVLVPQDASHGYASWDVAEAEKAAARQQGGEHLKLRLYDVTDINLDTQEPHSVAEFDCLESDRDRQVFIGDPTASTSHGRDYIAELGYSTPEGNWLKLVRSDSAHFSSGQDESILPG